MRSLTSIVLACLVLVGGVACSAERASTVNEADSSNSAMEIDMPGRQDTDRDKQALDDEIQAVVAAAMAAFAERTAVSLDAIEVIEARRVTWGDGAMGCPSPGMMYTQALVPGYYIHLRASGEDGFFHAGRDGRPVYCPADRSQPPVDPSNLD
jgi:hypothetical protein